MIFIAGNSRSGTTLMGRRLGNQPDIFTFTELHFLEEIWMPVDKNSVTGKKNAINIFSNLLSIQREGYLKKRKPEKYLNEAAQAVKSFHLEKITFAFQYERFLKYEAERNGKKIPCEKTPRNVLYINELLNIYPDCKIVCMVRDPKDVMLSQKKKWKRRFLGASASIPLKESIRARINYHPFIIARLWNANALAIAAHKNSLRVKILFFENLISNAEPEVRELCSFLGIPFHNSMLMVEQKGSSVEFDNTQEAKIDSSKTGNWKSGLNNTEVFICESITQRMRNEFQYADTGAKPSYLHLAFYYVIFPLQLFIAFIINIGRTKNIFQSIKKRLS